MHHYAFSTEETFFHDFLENLEDIFPRSLASVFWSPHAEARPSSFVFKYYLNISKSGNHFPYPIIIEKNAWSGGVLVDARRCDIRRCFGRLYPLCWPQVSAACSARVRIPYASCQNEPGTTRLMETWEVNWGFKANFGEISTLSIWIYMERGD